MAPPQIAAAAQYSQIVWGFLLGWCVFGVVPAARAMIGVLLVMLGSILALRACRAPEVKLCRVGKGA
jgi:drug/metabolite transporter (DMT)-like permease